MILRSCFALNYICNLLHIEAGQTFRVIKIGNVTGGRRPWRPFTRIGSAKRVGRQGLPPPVTPSPTVGVDVTHYFQCWFALKTMCYLLDKKPVIRHLLIHRW